MGNILIENGKAIGALSSPATADSVIYDNTQSEMTATNVQDAIDEINTNMDNCGNLVELEYGVSTYAEFLEAYQKHKIVYCKASSSGTNPAYGSKVRKAFMAYVNNDTKPTEVEFQYYRSLTTYSEANQHDEVHIYKLSSRTGWSYTKRVAGQNIEVSNGLNATFGSNKVTLSLDKSIVANNLTTTTEGSVLDARQGKVLNDKISELNADLEWKFIDSVAVTGATGATNSKNVTIPSSAKELLICAGLNNIVAASSVGLPSNSYIDAGTSAITNTGAIATSYYGEFDKANSVLRITIQYRSGGNLTVSSSLYYR